MLIIPPTAEVKGALRNQSPEIRIEVMLELTILKSTEYGE